MGKFGRERYCCATRTEAAGERGRVLLRCSSITQLASESVSPASHIAVVEDGAGVGISGRDRHGRAPYAEAAREGGRAFVGCFTITQLSVVCASPA